MGLLSSIYSLFTLYALLIQPGTNALAHRPQSVLAPLSQPGLDASAPSQGYLSAPSDSDPSGWANTTAGDLLYALAVMQDAYFELWQGTWPSAIDWTAAVVGTDVSATLESLSAAVEGLPPDLAHDERAFENLINYYFDQTSTFYFGENAVSLRAQAFDDMMWVVLGWLENIKFQVLHADLHYNASWSDRTGQHWHGAQFRVPAAHRARLFYGLASGGWDERLCGGGMIWNPRLTPYKNAITNELYISSSIAMYLYFPGDMVDSPFVRSVDEGMSEYPHNPADLKAATEAYAWLKNSNMTGVGGLYADGFHISGWKSEQQPGTRECDVLNTMIYTYNQGVILSGLRGLWLATLSEDYLLDAHDLVGKVIAATGWPDTSSRIWSGLGRGGVLEDTCDSSGDCSQNGQTFKGIFFHHLAELCRPLRPQEVRFLESNASSTSMDWRAVFRWHQGRCRLYRGWIEHNAHAALVTRDKEGKFGMWWGRAHGVVDSTAVSARSPLPPGAVDYRNHIPSTSEERDVYGLGDVALSGQNSARISGDPNDRGRGRTVETQSGGVAVLRALYQWETSFR